MRAHRPEDGTARVAPGGPEARKAAAFLLAGHAGRAAAGRPAAGDVAALQRALGNAAVSRILGDERVDGAAVQRSAVAGVLRAPGRALDGAVRADMEARFGEDFSDVRLHTGTEARRSAAEVGARAYTSGNHVVVGDGGADRHTLAHELTHVIQQRRGPVAGTDNGSGLSVSDPSDRFEREAEATAHQVLSHPAGAEPVMAGQHTAESRPQAAPVQRAVVLAGTVYSNQHAGAHEKDSGPLWKEIETFVRNEPPERQKEFQEHQLAMKQQLDKWVNDAGAGEKDATNKHHPVYGRKARNHSYPGVAQLYAGVLGWVRQKPGRHREKELAEQVKGNDEVEVNLDIVLAKVHTWITGLGGSPGSPGHPGLKPGMYDQIIKELGTGLVNGRQYGTYRTHFDKVGATNPAARTGIGSDLLAVLAHPEKYDIRDKIVTMHDAMEYFLAARHGAATAGSGLLPPPHPDQITGTSEIGSDGHRAKAVHSKGMHVDRGVGFITRDEGDPTTTLARQHNVPVWVGQSETTARMMNQGAYAGASGRQLSAAAWALFAFWRLDYDHTVKWGYHTLHEVLDIASNFGVPYNMLDREEGLRGFSPGSTLSGIEAWAGHLRQEHPKLARAVHDHDSRSAAPAPQLSGVLADLGSRVAGLSTAAAQYRKAETAGQRQEQQAALRQYALLCDDAIRVYQHIHQVLAAAPPPPQMAAAPAAAGAHGNP